MIQPSELRIGNYLYYIEDGAIVQIAGISEDSTIHLKGEGKSIFGRDLREFARILLDAALLERCGFVLGARIEIFVEQGEHIGRRIILDGCENGGLKYLHQLQNLYFALTAVELPVKL